MLADHSSGATGLHNVSRAGTRSFTSICCYNGAGGQSNVQALKESRQSRRRKNPSVVSQDIVDRQKELAESKNEFLKEKGLERRTIQNMIAKLKTQTN